MKSIDITFTGTGPGSQPLEADGAQLEYMQLPGEMQTFVPPVLPEPEEIEGCEAALELLDKLLSAAKVFDQQGRAQQFDLSGFDQTNRTLIDQVLGEGEVSVRFHNPEDLRIQESVLAGIWRVQHLDAQGRVVKDLIEIGAVPAVLLSEVFSEGRRTIQAASAEQAEVLLNAPSLLVELADKVAAYQPGDEPHVINLTLLPHSPEDLEHLDTSLGAGRVAILSRGYGNCRITSTGITHVWWVQFFNSTDVIILNTIEVVDVPLVAKASREDIQDSAQRLEEILAVYQQ
ncbi:MAG: hydrogenase expression/formation protein [Chromatiales bacterium]|nr:hydrogenase expression/formation protein [Chromatiales bacterium]